MNPLSDTTTVEIQTNKNKNTMDKVYEFFQQISSQNYYNTGIYSLFLCFML